jgi:hypothetical protein
MGAERSAADDSTSRARILEALTAHGVDDADELATDIDRALFGPEPGEWVGPLLTVEELEELRLDHYQPLTDALRHIDCQAATIRNENVENGRLRDRVAELEPLSRCMAPIPAGTGGPSGGFRCGACVGCRVHRALLQFDA